MKRDEVCTFIENEPQCSLPFLVLSCLVSYPVSRVLPFPRLFLVLLLQLPASPIALKSRHFSGVWDQTVPSTGKFIRIPAFSRGLLAQRACGPSNICVHEYLMTSCHESQMLAQGDAPIVITIIVI